MLKKRLLSAVLALAIAGVPIAASAAEIKAESFSLVSPYEQIDWDTYKLYKGNLHTHSSVSDGSASYRDMIYGAYEQGFDLLAFSEHGITGKAWNEKPFLRPLYSYQVFGGNSRKPLTNEEFYAVSNGSAPLASTGEPRGKGMFCVTGANELNAVTITKSHVNGYFLPQNFENLNWGFENGHEYAVSQVEKAGGLSHINHPGDWLGSKTNPDVINKAENIEYFADILLRYPSCLGVEAVNGYTSITPYDRVLWDNILMYCLPYGRNVFGFASSDAHTVSRLDDCYTYYILKDVSMESIRSCLESGSFFGATHKVVKNDVIGPSEDIYASDGTDRKLPRVKSLTTQGHRIYLNAENFSYIQWIANGRPLERTESKNGETVLDLDEFDTAEMLYVRCEIYNENGMVYSQPILLERNTQPLKYEREKTTQEKIAFALKSTRIYAAVNALFKLIVNAIKK